jgi:hypothetical protein
MARGGIRYGAGRPRERRTVEGAIALNIRQIQERGNLLPGRGFTSTWTRDGQNIASIRIAVDEWSLTLDFVADGHPVEQQIMRDQTQCHFGGQREWLICPRCGGRRATLYYAHRRFACRSCLNLAYRSQQLDIVDRSWKKQRKIEARMGGENAWLKPKGMHESTWQALRAKLSACEDMRVRGMYKFMQAFFRQYPDAGPISTPDGQLFSEK